MRGFLLFLYVFMALVTQAIADPLHDAVKDGDMAKVKLLIASGEDVNQNHKTMGTALHHVAIWGSAEMAELLISAGADVSALNKTLGSPLHRAARKGNEAVAAVLIAHGADVNARRDEGNTPLHDAAEGGHAGMIDLLVANGADVNARSSYSALKPGVFGWAGFPPVHPAGSNDHFDIVDLLRAYGAGPPDLEPLSKFMASASPDEGERLFNEACAACHTAEKGGLDNRGANLWGILGRKKASVEGFAYSAAFDRLVGTWTLTELNAFIAAPTTYVPGTKMRIEDLPDPVMRANLIAFLRLKNDNPPPLPQPVPASK
jgi:cytochrome c